MVELRTKHMKWEEDGVAGYSWPLNRYESKALVRDIIFAIVGFGQQLRQEEHKTLLKILATDICLISSTLFSAEKMAKFYRVQKQDVNVPENYKIWKAALTENYNNLPNFSSSNIEKGKPKSPVWKRALRPLIYYNSGFKRGTLTGLNEQTDIVCTALSSLTIAHQKQRNKKIILLSFDEWFYPENNTPTPYYDLNVINNLIDVAGRHGIHPSRASINFLAEIIAKNMAWVRLYKERMRGLKIPQELWVTSQGNLYARILASEVLEQGGKVIVHDHAEGGNFSQDIHTPFNELQLTSKFITFNQYQAEQYKKTASTVVIDSKAPDILSLSGNQSAFKMPATQINIIKHRKNKASILYPCPLINTDIINPIPLMSGIEMVDWQCRLFHHLNQAGFQIHFKPHPLSKQPFPNYAKRFDLIQLDAPFEKVMENAEHLLFDWTLTTTFGNALSSNVPISIIDFGIVDYSDFEKEQLKKRCHWISGTIDAKNRSHTDWKQLIECLNNPKEYNA